jgi:iron-sulfur cluster assembly protein
MSDSVTITASAAVKLKGILEAESQADKGLRIRVVPGGCSGYSYDMVFDVAGEKDKEFESHGLKLVVDEESMDLLKGAEIDFQESFGNSGFTIKNPNSTGGCGCGKSFQA